MSVVNILLNLFVSSIASGGIFLLFWHYFAQKGLEYYKNEFNKDLEKLKADYIKGVSNFNIFNSKKHEIYSGINSNLVEANNFLMSHYGLVQVPDFSTYTEANIKLFLSENYFDMVREDTFNLWFNNQQLGITELNRLFESRRINDTKQKVLNFNKYFLDNKLYISDQLISIIEDTWENMRLLLTNIEFLFEHKEINNRDLILQIGQEQKIHKENIKNNIPKIIEQLRNELKN